MLDGEKSFSAHRRGRFYREQPRALSDVAGAHCRRLRQIDLCGKSGKLKRLYEAHSTVGRMEDNHDMSSKRLNGLELKIKNDSGITINEVEEFAQTFLANDELVRQLLTIGYSTLIIKGTTNNIIQYYRLCDSFQS